MPPKQKPYVRYAGSPDVFERASGKYIPYEQAQKTPDFFGQVEEFGPDIKNPFVGPNTPALSFKNEIESRATSPSANPSLEDKDVSATPPSVREPRADDNKDAIVNRLIDALARSKPGKSLEEQYKELKQSSGTSELETKVGSFDEEITKTRNLLSDLDTRIRGGLAREEARHAPMELILGRQRELARQGQEQRQGVVDVLGSLQTGRGQLLETLGRKEKDILQMLQLREKDRSMPLDLIKEEIGLRKDIKDLTKEDIAKAVSTQVDEKGNVTIITQDPLTGKFATTDMGKLGKETAPVSDYQTFSTQVDDAGNATVIGIKKDGNSQVVGQFAGVGKAKAVAAATDKPPTSYQEWQLAGGKEGTGMTYAKWIQRKDVSNSLELSDGRTVDITTKEGIKAIMQTGGPRDYAGLYALLDTHAVKLTAAGIDNLLQSVGVTKPVTMQSAKGTIMNLRPAQIQKIAQNILGSLSIVDAYRFIQGGILEDEDDNGKVTTIKFTDDQKNQLKNIVKKSFRDSLK